MATCFDSSRIIIMLIKMYVLIHNMSDDDSTWVETCRNNTKKGYWFYKEYSCVKVVNYYYINRSSKATTCLTFMVPCVVKIFQYISNKMQRYTVYFIWKLLYVFRVVPPPIIRSANNCIYSIWCLSHRYS
jgi:hypothetical protein